MSKSAQLQHHPALALAFAEHPPRATAPQAETDSLENASGTRRRAVFLTHSTFASPFRVGSHQLALALGKLGWEVLHIPTPVTLAHIPAALRNPIYRERVSHLFKSFRPIATGVKEFIPFAGLPWQVVRRLPARAASLYAAGQIAARSRIARQGFANPDILFIDEPRLIGMAAWFKPVRSVYRATDLYEDMMGDPTVIAAERRALAETDGFIATSQPVFNHLRTLAPTKSGLLVENGVDLDHFTQSTGPAVDLQDIPAPRAIYVGAMDERFDLAAVIALAQQRPEVSFVLIGPGEKPSAGIPANLHFLGPRPYEVIPAYLRQATVGLLPLSLHRANRGRSPMKIYEYGAAGLPVIASGTAELRRRQLPFVLLYNQTGQLPELLDEALAHQPTLATLARNTSARMSWAGRLQEIMEFLTALPPVTAPGRAPACLASSS